MGRAPQVGAFGFARQARGRATGVFQRKVLDEEALEELETALLTADVGVGAPGHLLADLKARYRKAGDGADPKSLLREALLALIGRWRGHSRRPGTALRDHDRGRERRRQDDLHRQARQVAAELRLRVLLAAGDTFRAAAREQLTIWGERNDVAVIAQDGGDPAAVTFDAIAAAKARGPRSSSPTPPGRLPTQLHLMEELRKVKRVIAKAIPDAPHEVFLVLDANTGQNALAQVKAFDAAVGLTGLMVTKLDGSAKGGVVAAIAKQHPVPIRFIGVGESLDDLQPVRRSGFRRRAAAARLGPVRNHVRERERLRRAAVRRTPVGRA